ncbi:MAG TPA: hypothetical protein VJM32_04685 [Candidatus Saccharimonadales bacterium]|nr:hypothetical protein [Candidatus Saccharimonadales bacterium]
MKRSSSAGFVPVSLILNFVLAVILVGVSGFAIWAFVEYQDHKNNVDGKVAAAVKDAKADQQKEDQAAFLEQEKLPTRELTGPAELGGVSLAYPKTWSVYLANNGENSQYEAYLHPGAVPSTQNRTSYALRVSVVNASYESTTASYSQKVKEGELKASPIKVNELDGLRLDGKFTETIQGSMVLFKIRDKTLRVYTENNTYVADFDKIVLPSLKFNI